MVGPAESQMLKEGWPTSRAAAAARQPARVDLEQGGRHEAGLNQESSL
jgi:hypothetical protein